MSNESRILLCIITGLSDVYERVGDYYLTSSDQFTSYIIAKKTSYIRWDDNDVRFEPNQRTQLDF